MKRRILIGCVILGVCAWAVVACQKKSSTHADVKKERAVRMVVAKKAQHDTKLFYSGAVKPITVSTISSPVEGIVTSTQFNYGQMVKKGQRVLTISSPKLQDELHNAVSAYAKTKEAFHNSKLSFEGTKQLYEEKIISRKEFTGEKTQMENNELSYLDAKFKLEQLIHSVPGLNDKLKGISLNDVKNIRKIFDQKFDLISLQAKRTGIVLFPVKKNGKESENNEIEEGSEVKKGQALLSVGDLSSLGVEFEAGEMEINRLKSGLSVQVTTPAIPGMVLKGEIASVAVQATSNQRFGDNAKFLVKVKVTTIDKQYQALLRVGMSVRIEVDLQNKPEVTVPISALKKKSGKAQVLVLDEKSKKNVWKTVKPGVTGIDNVAITSGIAEGDKVIVNDRT